MITIAPRKKAKQLTNEDILSLSSGLDETTPITINIEKDGKTHQFNVNINKYFRDSKLELMATRYISYLQQLRQTNDVSEKTIIGTFKLLPTLLIQEFSDVPIVYDIKSIEDLIHVQSNLGDLGILSQVYNAFNESEITKAGQVIDRMAKEAGRLMGDIAVQQALKEIQSQYGNNEPEAVGSSN